MQIPHEDLLQLGLKENKIVSIHDVANGLDCGCFCPKCKGHLIARNKGKIKQPHFAHSNKDNCIGSVESAIHLLAKEIFFEERQLFIPSFEKYLESELKAVELMKFNKILNFDLVFYEQVFTWLNDFIIVDAVALISGKLLLIEFANTHFVDDKKQKILKNLGFPCLEINLQNASQIKSKLKVQLKSQYFSSTWLINPKGDLMLDQYLEKLNQATEKRKADEKQHLQWKTDHRKADERLKLEDYNQRRKVAETKGTIVSECPVFLPLFEQYAKTKYGSHPIIKKLLKGDWNGVIYEYKQGHLDLFIDGERHFIHPENFNNLIESEKLKCDELHCMVLLFRAYHEKFFGSPCSFCKLFHGYFERSLKICGYKEGMALDKYFIFPAKF